MRSLTQQDVRDYKRSNQIASLKLACRIARSMLLSERNTFKRLAIAKRYYASRETLRSFGILY
jgi:hypothetical protein